MFSGSGPTLKQLHEVHGASHGSVGTAQPNPVANEQDPNYGPFWTVPVTDESVKGSPFASLMTLDAVDLPQHEAFQIAATPERPAKATIHAEWRPGVGPAPQTNTVDAYTFRSARAGFAGTYILSQAVVDFSFTSETGAADNSPYTFKTNREGQRVLFAQMGHEVNGVFFPEEIATDRPR